MKIHKASTYATLFIVITWIGVFCNFFWHIMFFLFLCSFLWPNNQISYILLYSFLIISEDTFSSLSIITLYLKFPYFPLYLILFLGNKKWYDKRSKVWQVGLPTMPFPPQRGDLRGPSTSTVPSTSLQERRREQRTKGWEGVEAHTEPGK